MSKPTALDIQERAKQKEALIRFFENYVYSHQNCGITDFDLRNASEPNNYRFDENIIYFTTDRTLSLNKRLKVAISYINSATFKFDYVFEINNKVLKLDNIELIKFDVSWDQMLLTMFKKPVSSTKHIKQDTFEIIKHSGQYVLRSDLFGKIAESDNLDKLRELCINSASNYADYVINNDDPKSILDDYIAKNIGADFNLKKEIVIPTPQRDELITVAEKLLGEFFDDAKKHIKDFDEELHFHDFVWGV